MTRVWRWIPLAAVLALLGAAMLAGVFANPVIHSVPQDPGPVRSAPAQPRSQPPAEQQAPPSAAPVSKDDSMFRLLIVIGLGVLSLAGLVAVLAMVWLALRDRLTSRRRRVHVDHPAGPELTTSERVRAAVDEGLAELDDLDGDPRAAVIACWVRLERAAAAAGTPREIGDTSTELVERLLTSHAVSAAVLDDFAAVYRQARFATHTVDMAMRDRARSALRQVRDELSVGVR
jgi:hypothetical protein